MIGTGNSASPTGAVAIQGKRPDDELRHLPETARAKLTRLLDHEAAEAGAVHAISERISEARRERAHFAAVLDVRMPQGRQNASDKQQIDDARDAASRRDEADATVKRLEQQRAGIEARRSRIGHRCLEYIRRLGDRDLHVHLTEVRLPKGVTADSIADQIASLRVQEHDTLRQQRHSSHRLAEALAWVDRIAERGDPGIERFFTTGSALKLPQHRINEPLRGNVISGSGTGGAVVVGAGYEVPDGSALAVWANLDAIKARIAATAAEQDDTDAITDDDRAAELTRIRAATLEAERVLVLLAEQDGWCPDADPRAVLGLSGDLPAPT